MAVKALGDKKTDDQFVGQREDFTPQTLFGAWKTEAAICRMEEEGKKGCPGTGTSLNRGTEIQNRLGREYSETGGQKAHWETEAKNSRAKASFSG